MSSVALSFIKGFPIAKVRGGRKDGHILRLDERHRTIFDEYGDPILHDDDEPAIVFNEQWIRRQKGGLGKRQIAALVESIQQKTPPEDRDLQKLYRKAMSQFSRHQEVSLGDGETFVPLMEEVPEQGCRVSLYGPSGAGKSFTAGGMVKEYKNEHPDRPFFLFSKHARDKALDKYSPKRITIDEEFLENPPDIDDLFDSCVVFDDIDLFPPKIAKSLQLLRDNCLENGRHHNICVITVGHELLGGFKTKKSHTESQRIVLFPGRDSYAVREWLKRYMKLPASEINKIMESGSRWAVIHKESPNYVLTENGCWLLGATPPPEIVYHGRKKNEEAPKPDPGKIDLPLPKLDRTSRLRVKKADSESESSSSSESESEPAPVPHRKLPKSIHHRQSETETETE